MAASTSVSSSVSSTPESSSISSTSSAPASTPSTITCSANGKTYVNGQTYTEEGVDYLIRCSSDNSQNAYKGIGVSTGGFSTCFDVCNADAECNGFTFVGDNGGNCYLKAVEGNYPTAPNYVVSAFRISPRAPISSSSPGVTPTLLSTSLSSSSSSPVAASTSSAEVSVTTTTETSSVVMTTSSSDVSTTQVSITTVTETPVQSTATSVQTSSTSASATTVTQSVATGPPSSCSAMAAKGGNVVDVNGEEYIVRCGWDHAGRDIAARSAASFGDCQPLCDATPGCQAYAYLGGDGPGTCYLKDSLSGGALSYADFASKVGALPIVVTSTTVAPVPTTSTTVNTISTSASSVVMVTSTGAAPTTETTTVFPSSISSPVVKVTTTQTSKGPVATDGRVDMPANNPPVEHEDIPAESSTVETSTSTIGSASTSTFTRRVRTSSASASATVTTTTVRPVTRTTTRPAAATATGPVVDPVDTNHGCGALNHKGGMFYLRTHVTHGDVLRFENLYLQQTPY
ncbi:hypothetical protein LTR04_003564, partial [Oleoguttula sp. CCFEE 6159]